MALKPKSRKVFDYLKEHYGEDIVAENIAQALGVSTPSVNGSVTAGLQSKGLAQRTAATIELDDGTIKTVKFISLTEEGCNYDPDAQNDEDK